jgi:Methyltransferase domain
MDEEEAKSLGPWWYCFEYEGQEFGGDIPRDLRQVDQFFEWLDSLGASVSSILELGSHEGSHTFALAAHPDVHRVLALEGREDNLARARFVRDLYDAHKVEFRQANLEDFDPQGTFDAVFCAGLLYHLPEPWKLIERLAPITRWLFIDTHYSETDGHVLAFDYRGKWQNEGPDPLSGLSPFSFWLSFRQLMLVLLDNGFAVRFARDNETHHGPRVWLLAEQQHFA